MRLRILLVVTAAMIVLSCVKHDVDPKLQPFLFTPQERTIFTDSVPDDHLVCAITPQYQHDAGCVTLKQVRRLILQQAAGL